VSGNKIESNHQSLQNTLGCTLPWRRAISARASATTTGWLLNYQYRAAVWAASLLFLDTTAALMSREESDRFSTTKYDPRRAGWKSRLLGTARNLLLLGFVRAGHVAGEAIPSA